MRNRKWKKRRTAFTLAVLMLVSSLPFSRHQAYAAEETLQTEQTMQNIQTQSDSSLKGITLNKKTLIMKTGETASLTAVLLPEGTDASPEITWESDDPAVVTVSGNGTEAVVTAPEGTGGSATVTVRAGSFTASCRVLVTVQEPMLESLLFMQNSSGSRRYELTELEAGSREYTLRIPESALAVFVRPTLRDDLPETTSIVASFEDAMTGNPVEIPVSTDVTTSLSSRTAGYLIKSYNTDRRELLITVSDGTKTEEYVIHVVRGSYLGGLSVKSETGEALSYTPSFVKTTYAYSLHVPSSMKELELGLKGAESYHTLQTVNGEPAENGSYRLSLSQGVVKAVLRSGDGGDSVPYEYVLTVYVDEACYLTVNLEPETAVFALYDENGEQIDPVDGRYEVIKDASYTYTVSAPGYQSQSGSLIGGKEEKLEFRLEKSADNTLEELASEWGGYWKTTENLNIVSAATPSSANNTEILWKQKYGKNSDALGSLSDGILVEDDICCFYGNQLVYLNKETGEIEKSVTMQGPGNSTFVKPLYAAGMIVVPQTEGRLQCFHAKTLEPLWRYQDTIGGNAATALRYDSGYLYAGFADGNLVCLSAADEEPDKRDEKKTAIWRRYDSGGYYRTGVYTGDTCLYASGRSGTVYCLNKTTGVTLQKFSLPAEQGIISTGICYGSGRIWFATDKGYLCSYPLAEDGTLDTEKASAYPAGGTVYGTPVVYKNRIYVASASVDTYQVVTPPYYLNVINLEKDGSLSLAYRMELTACPKGSGTLSTAYEKTEGYVCLYYTTDSTDGRVYLIKDQAEATEPGPGSGVLYQQNEVAGSGSGNVLVDSAGRLYFRYESSWIYALKPSDVYLDRVESLTEGAVLDGGAAFDRQAVNHEIVVPSDCEEVTVRFYGNEGAEVFLDGEARTEKTYQPGEEPLETEIVLTKNGQLRSYHFRIRRQHTDTSLENLQVSYSEIPGIMDMELEPAFAQGQTEYKSSIFGNGDYDFYYIWPVLPENAGSTMKVTVLSGAFQVEDGTELEPLAAVLDGGIRTRYKVKAAGAAPVELRITVTAEDGKKKQDYHLTLSRNNDLPKVTAGFPAMVSRGEKGVLLRINASMDGYLYYLPDIRASSNPIPSASVMKRDGQRIAVKQGENLVMLEGFTTAESVVYLYEMSYAQRWSSGIRVDVPAYDGSTEPDLPEVKKGDLNRDGKINLTDVVVFLDRLTAGDQVDASTGDLNEDGTVSMTDLVMLLDQVTGG